MSGEVDTAVLALIATDAYFVPGQTLWDGDVGDSNHADKTISAALPYAVYYTTPGYPINPRMNTARSRAQEFQVTYVGKTREQAVWAGDKIEAALHEQRITVGSRSRLVRRTEDQTFVRRDDTWTRPDGGPLFTGVLRFVVDY